MQQQPLVHVAEPGTETLPLHAIGDAHTTFTDAFQDFFSEAGYESYPPAPLLNDVDDSVIFTGASISAVKPVLLSGNYPKGGKGIFVNGQMCLRTRALKHAFNNSKIPFGQTFFHMSTVHVPSGKFISLVQEAIEFTVGLGVLKENIILRSTRLGSKESAVIHKHVDIQVLYDDREPAYYKWTYGLPGVEGEGIGIHVLNSGTGKFWDVGNIVRISTARGEELGSEFGYGVEFFLSALFGYVDPTRMSKVFDVFPYVTGLENKYFTYMEAVVNMRIAGVEIGHHGASHIYKKYLKSLQFMGEGLGKSITDVINDMQLLMNNISDDTGNLRAEQAFLTLHVQRKSAFTNLVKRIGKYLWALQKGNNPKEVFVDPWETLNKYLLMNGIAEQEVSSALERLERFRK